MKINRRERDCNRRAAPDMPITGRPLSPITMPLLAEQRQAEERTRAKAGQEVAAKEEAKSADDEWAEGIAAAHKAEMHKTGASRPRGGDTTKFPVKSLPSIAKEVVTTEPAKIDPAATAEDQSPSRSSRSIMAPTDLPSTRQRGSSRSVAAGLA